MFFTMVEVLRNTSTLVKNNAAPGMVYKNVNIWAGTSGFAVPKNIKEGIIGFKVQNSWLETNGPVNIKLVKWNATEWLPLETVEISQDNLYTYYEARTNAFSPIAITAFKVDTQPKVTQKPSAPGEILPPKTPASLEKEKSWGLKEILNITGAVLAMIITMISVAYIKEKKKK